MLYLYFKLTLYEFAIIFIAPLALEEPKLVSIPVVALDKVDGSTTTKDFPVLLPHKILKYLFETAQIEIHEDNLRKFWSHLREVQHPWVHSIDPTTQFIPIGVHGDEAHYGADTANINKLTCIFLDLPLWRPKNARLSRFLMFCIDSSQCVGYETLHPVLQSIAESINWVYFGMDETGQITTQRKFILSELRGDQVWHRYIWRHLNWWRKRECCFRCGAVQNILGPNDPLYYDTRDDAAWKNTIVGTVDFIANGVSQYLLCPFATCMKFNVDLIKNCSMHCVNLGLAFTSNGACLKLLLDLGCFGDPSTELKFRLNTAFDDFQMFCKLKKLQCSQRRFKVKHLMKDAHGPYLTTKAYNARCIVAWMASCTMDAFNGNFSQNRLFGIWLLQNNLQIAHELLASHTLAINELAKWFSLSEQFRRCLLLVLLI